jgi:Flp pilus assembly protein TadG
MSDEMTMTPLVNALDGSRISRASFLRRRRGGALLEMAIMGVLLCVVCFGAVEGGQYFYVKSVMTDAAREGCRNGIAAYSTGSSTAGSPPQGSASSINSVIIDQLLDAKLIPTGTTATSSAPNWVIGNFTVSFYDVPSLTGTATQISDPNGNMTVGDGLVVQITANWNVVGANFRGMGLIGSSSSPHTITVSCMMRKEAL